MHRLIVRSPGWASLVYHLPEASADGAIEAGTITLQLPRLLSGVVLDGDGQPVPRIKVTLSGTNADRERMAALPVGDHLAGWGLLGRYVGLSSVRTDDRGRFAFGNVPGGTFRVAGYGSDGRPLEARTGVKVDPDADPAPIEIRVAR